MISCCGENHHFGYKKDKMKMQILNRNTKIIENKHFIVTSNNFAVFVCIWEKRCLI